MLFTARTVAPFCYKNSCSSLSFSLKKLCENILLYSYVLIACDKKMGLNMFVVLSVGSTLTTVSLLKFFISVNLHG
jgi:hypothetical protein